MCKGNHAAWGKEIMPRCVNVRCKPWPFIWVINAIDTVAWRRFGIDKLEYCYIIIFTHGRAQDSDAKTKPASRQTTGLASPSLSQPVSGTRSRRTVSDQRFLRRRRLGSGQVRDA